MGQLDILNCGAGHLTFSFDKEDPSETAQAKKCIEDMLNRGYTIFVEIKPAGKKPYLRRVKKFSKTTEEYIVEAPEEGKKKTKAIPMKIAKATGIGPTAGG